MENQKTDVAVIEQNSNGLVLVDMNGQLPDLAEAEVMPFDLMADYWTPEKSMESKRVIFTKIDSRMVLDQQSQDLIELECAFFIESTKEGARTVSNGSKRLVGSLQANGIQPGTPLLITYLGKKSNRTNAFKSDNWSVKPLRLAI